MSYETVISSVNTGKAIGTVTLNRPEKRNALNATMVDEIGSALDELIKDEAVRVIVLNANGGVFCAGADLQSIRDLQSASHEENLEDSRKLRDLFLKLYSSPKPTIAAVHGPALAGGAGLATCCDFIVASERASFGYPEVKIGFVAALVMVLLTRQIGERRVKNLLLTGDAITAAQAGSMGLATSIVLHDSLNVEVEAIASKLCHASPEATALTKEFLAQVWDGDLEANLEKAAQFNATTRATTDCKEGIAAFVEKRKPNWLNG